MGLLSLKILNLKQSNMKRIEITSPQIRGKAYLGIREITGWWSSKKSYDTRYKITEARLEDTVYFVINTSGVRSGTEINLQLYNLEELFFLDYLCPDTYRFNGKIETAETHIQNDYAIIEIQLPRTWTKDVEEDGGVLELYWKVTSSNMNGTCLPKSKKNFLNVKVSDRDLFIKPSYINSGMPEVYTKNGEQLFFIKFIEDEIKDEIAEETIEALEYYKDKIALAKLAKGYMVNNEGKIYESLSDGSRREVYDCSYYTTDGKIIYVKQGRNWTTRTGDGKILSTKGINQYEHFANNGARVTILNLFSKGIGYWDIFSSVTNMNASDNSKPLSVSLPGVTGRCGMAISLLVELGGLIAEDMYYKGEEVEADYMHSELGKIKNEGLDAVKQTIRQFGNSKKSKLRFGIIYVSPQIADDIIKGKYKHFEDLRRASNESDDESIAVLYETFESKNGKTYLINSFYISQQNDY